MSEPEIIVDGYITGVDAIDVARLTELELHRGASRISDRPDTSWQQADALVASGTDPDEFYIDINRLSKLEAANVILSLIGAFQAWHDYSMSCRG